MADQKKYKALPKFKTPAGTMKWPKLNEPDYGNEKFPKPDGEYSTKLVLNKTDPAVQALLTALENLHAEAVEEGKEKFKELKLETRKSLEKKNGKDGIQINDLYKPVYDQDTEQETDEIEFKFGFKASGVSKKTKKKWTRKPALFDAKGKPMSQSVLIWSGTTAKIAFEADKYFIPGTGAVGVSLKPIGFQILQLVTKGQRSAESMGFEAEEGYEFSAADVEAATEDTATEGTAEETDANTDF